MSPYLSLSRRLRVTPFSRRVDAAGVQAYTVYNHMRLPTMFQSAEEDCRHLKQKVQVWDVACERQVEIVGPDAKRLMRMLTPRDLESMNVGQCRYIPVVDDRGGMLNDPVALKLADDRYWISLADSDLLLWVKGLALGAQFDVDVNEPDVSPLAVQGPLSDTLMARIFGDAVRDIRFFRFGVFEYAGRELRIARSGYSKQGGFEIYVEGSDLGEPIWDALFSAGIDLDVRAGGPNLIERVESGLLSYGNDMTRENSPFECGLGKFCDLDTVETSIGRDALLRERDQGPLRMIRSLAIEGPALPPCAGEWPVMADGVRIGQITSAAWSPDFRTNVAIGMIDRSHWHDGNQVTVETVEGARSAVVREKSFN